MQLFLKTIDIFVRAGHVSAALIVVALTVLILVEIALRFIFGSSTHLAEEYAAYGMAAVVYLGAAIAMKNGDHIRISLVRSRLSARGKLWLDRGVYLGGVVFSSLLLWAFASQLLDAWSYDTRSFHPSRTPMWIPYGFVTLGAVFLLAQILRQLIDSFIVGGKTEKAG